MSAKGDECNKRRVGCGNQLDGRACVRSGGMADVMRRKAHERARERLKQREIRQRGPNMAARGSAGDGGHHETHDQRGRAGDRGRGFPSLRITRILEGDRAVLVWREEERAVDLEGAAANLDSTGESHTRRAEPCGRRAQGADRAMGAIGKRATHAGLRGLRARPCYCTLLICDGALCVCVLNGTSGPGPRSTPTAQRVMVLLLV